MTSHLLPAKQSQNEKASRDTSNAASSAYKNKSHAHAEFRSLMYAKNNSGPKTLPCGTPHVIAFGNYYDFSQVFLFLFRQEKQIMKFILNMSFSGSFSHVHSDGNVKQLKNLTKKIQTNQKRVYV